MIDERDEILKTMRGTPLVLERLARDLPDAALRARPAEGEWAIIEVIAHLGDTDERALGRTRRMLTEDEPTLEPYDPAALAIQRNYIAMDLTEQLARFAAVRAEYVAVLSGLDGHGWERVGHHGEHGRITVRQLAAHTAGEDGDHLTQIARLIPAG